MTPILYSFRRCPYAMRARLALWSSGQTCCLREVILGKKPSALLEASPKGTVPVLDLGEGRGVIEESLEIMIWALKLNDPDAWLMADPLRTNQLIQQNDGPFKRDLDAYKYPERQGRSGEEARVAGLRFLEGLEAELSAARGGYLFGGKPTLADFAIFPFVRQFASIDKAWFDARPLPRLQLWLNTLLVSEIFELIMQRYEAWRPEQEDIRWGRLS